MIYFSHGDGTFAPGEALPYPPSTGEPFAPWICDLNTDGISDLLVSAMSGTRSIMVYLGEGGGQFADYRIVCAGSFALGSVIDRFDADDRMDLVITTSGARVSSFRGNGDGTFAVGEFYPAGGQSPVEMALGDLNGDQLEDVAVVNYGSATVGILLAQLDGTLAPAVSLSVGIRPSGIAIADLDGDQNLDLAVSDLNADGVHILLGNGDGTFGLPALMPAGDGPEAVCIADLDGDQIPDLATADWWAGTATVLHGLGDGSFVHAATLTAQQNPVSIAAADFYGDSHLDLVVANSEARNLSLFPGLGGGSFGTAVVYSALGRPHKVVTPDVNQDLHPDMLMPCDQGLAIYLGDGAGGFSGPLPCPSVGSLPQDVAVGDINSDAILDLVVPSYLGSTLHVLLGEAGGSYVCDEFTYGAGDSPTAAILHDFDGDDRLDLLAANHDTHDLTLLRGTGGTASV
jgi:hypothetical protein